MADGAWHEVSVHVARRQIRLGLDGKTIFEETEKMVSVAIEVADEQRNGSQDLEYPFYVGEYATYNPTIFSSMYTMT